jgi:hypothetical protein
VEVRRRRRPGEGGAHLARRSFLVPGVAL